MLYTFLKSEKLSKLALGTATFGGMEKQTAFSIMEEFFNADGNVIDTARIYRKDYYKQDNTSESVIGEFLKENNLREKAFISTKGGHPYLPNFYPPRINLKDLTNDINESLRDLKVDFIDAYYLHRDDTLMPVEEIMPILHTFIKQGKTKYLGASNWSYSRIKKANEFAIKNNLTPFTFSEFMWSYASIDREGLEDKSNYSMTDNDYKFYKQEDIKIMAYMSQGQGFFSKLILNGENSLNERTKLTYLSETNLKKAQIIKDIYAKTGINPVSISLNYLLYNPIDTISIIGPSSVSSLKRTLTCFDLPKEYIKELF